MLSWWLIRFIGCLSVGIIYGQDNGDDLASIEPPQDSAVQVGFSVNDELSQQTNDTSNVIGNDVVPTRMMSTTTQTPEPFSCHECTNCNSKSDLVPRVCEPGINMCYKVEKRVGNTSRIIHRGCSASKAQCSVPNDDQTNTVESITCCASHKCNQATQFQQSLFFILTLSLFTILINISKDNLFV